MASKGRLMREICFGSKMAGEESAGGHELFKDNHTGTTYHISREKNQVLLAVPLLASSLKKNQNEFKKKTCFILNRRNRVVQFSLAITSTWKVQNKVM